MATNLRLRPETEEALRTEAARTSRSQQEIIREAVDRYLGLDREFGPTNDAQALVGSGKVLPARSKFKVLESLVELPPGAHTADLLDRQERF